MEMLVGLSIGWMIVGLVLFVFGMGFIGGYITKAYWPRRNDGEEYEVYCTLEPPLRWRIQPQRRSYICLRKSSPIS